MSMLIVLPPLRTQLIRHAMCRRVPCVLCGAFQEQHGVAVALFERHEHLGDVCLGCLAETPPQAALRVRRYARRLQAHAQEWRDKIATADPFARWQQAGPLVRKYARRLIRVLEEQAQTQQKYAFSLQRMERWHVSPADVHSAEQSGGR